MNTYLAATLGLVLLFCGGEGLVRGAVAVARRLGLSPLLIGVTVVAAGTSAPELLVSVSAALQGNADIAIGNVVGSNIFNVLVVLGVSALIAPIVVRPAEVRRDTLVMVGAMLTLAVVSLSGLITRPIGLFLILAVAGYTYYCYRTELQEKPARSAELHEGEELEGLDSLWLGILHIALGLGALGLGSDLLITGATGIARAFGVPETVIGLTLVAAGTSLPELATSVVAAFRGHSDVAVGNVLGSNIFNALAIIGTTAMVRPIGVAESIARLDVWVMTAAALVLVPLLAWRGRIGRPAGAALTVAYAAYAVLLLA